MTREPRSWSLARAATLLVLLASGACARATSGAATASPTPAPVTAAPTAPSGTLSPTSAAEVLTQGRAPFDACYDIARRSRPGLPRTSVELTFSLDEHGKLLTVDLDYRNRMDDAAKECMRAAAEALTFPSFLHGKQTATISFAPPSPSRGGSRLPAPKKRGFSGSPHSANAMLRIADGTLASS
jgi:hypothetical protein